MIVVRLSGGLGNQLFQYALGRRLAYERNVPLKLDLSWFTQQSLRSYRLKFFNVKAEILSNRQAAWYNSRHIIYRVQRVICRNLPPPLKFTRFDESSNRDSQENSAIFDTHGSLNLDGYWQSELYFKPIANLIREELQVITPPSNSNAKIAKEIRNGNAISLHIRRGDYVTNPKHRAKHGLLSLAYYQRAVEYVSEQVNNPHFFIFSDDHIWAQSNLNLAYPVTLVDINNAETDYEDLRLMMLCKHHIIANSSFSWWGAWLSQHSDKIVIAPEGWFQNMNEEINDPVPDKWLRM